MNGELVAAGPIASASAGAPDLLADAGPALTAVARDLTEVAGALAVVISWRSQERHGIAHWPAADDWRAAAAALASLTERRRRFASSDTPIFIAPDELAPVLRPLDLACTLSAAATTCELADQRVTAVLLFAASRPGREAALMTQLASRHALHLLLAQAAARSRDFWRVQASRLGERVAERDAGINRLIEARADQHATLEACLKLRARNRLAGAAAIIARRNNFDAWIVAVNRDDESRIVGASPPPAVAPGLAASLMAQAIRADSTVALAAASPAGAAATIFPGHACLCAPFPNGAFLFAARAELGAAVVARVDAAVRGLQPLIEKWRADEELARLRRLVRSLALRIFTAVDAERQRIARDLHDHQAQLLAAARVALAADPAEARGILKQLDDALRLRVRELRPASLGRANLREALRYEMSRLSDAGVKPILHYSSRMKPFARSIQQLCYEVAREAFSNVIRHADASRVEIAVERRRRQAILSVIDNGKGFADNPTTREAHAGIGVLGLTERVELMGGRLRIERRGATTCLTASIPEP